MTKNTGNVHKQVSQDLAKLFADDLSEQTAGRIGEAMDASEEYASEFISGACEMSDLTVLAKDTDIRRLLEEPLKKPARRWIKFATAAGLLLTAVVAWQWLWLPGEGARENVQRYITGIGEQKRVTLKDGSVVTLNTGTEILVTLNGDMRRVAMKRGEAFFDIAKDPSRSFSVELGSQTVSVLGTKFNIRRHPQQFTLALVEGVVALHPSSKPVAEDAQLIASADGREIALNYPGQRRINAGWVVAYNMEQERMLATKHSDLSGTYGWTTGFIEFHEQPLSRVVNELNRYSGKKILIGDSAIMDMKVYAGVRIDQLDQALQGLEKTLPIKIINDFDTIMIVGSSESQ
ncbi:MAG: FecR domain-containing protein [Porticoccaceae bacterium]|nr:FecR domain-containing protein [Porticoccaceae bacterium]